MITSLAWLYTKVEHTILKHHFDNEIIRQLYDPLNQKIYAFFKYQYLDLNDYCYAFPDEAPSINHIVAKSGSGFILASFLA